MFEIKLNHDHKLYRICVLAALFSIFVACSSSLLEPLIKNVVITAMTISSLIKIEILVAKIKPKLVQSKV